MPGAAPKFSLSDLGRGRFATKVWGESRAVINRVLFAMVRANHPSPFWLDIRGPEEAPSEPGPVELGWIPYDRLFLTRAELEETHPQDADANMAMLVSFSSDDPRSIHLSDRMRLPLLLQRILSRVGEEGGAHAIGIANADRVNQFYPVHREGMRAVFDPLLEASLLPFFSTAHPIPQREACDFVFEVRASGLADWKDGLLICDRAPPSSTISVGTEIPLSADPAIARALEGRPPD